jgi:16S rRNA (guanine966-N2)-methyltransferase
MRIISGIAKGRLIRMPRSAATRPATDLVRSAVFSILDSMDADWSRILDLYAGSGAMGLEALSRGAGWVDFVDKDHACCSTIKESSVAMGFGAQAHVYCGPVSRVLSVLKGPYGIVLLDPPYADETLPALLDRIATSTIVERGSVLIALHSARRVLATNYGKLLRLKERRHGDTAISLYTQEASL